MVTNDPLSFLKSEVERLRDEELQHSVEELDVIVGQFLEGKSPSDKKLVQIFNGTVGAGKTHHMKRTYDALPPEQQDNIVYAATDEHGSLFALPKYQEELQELKAQHAPERPPLEDRMNLRDKYQKDSHYIFNRLLVEAVERKLSLMVDMTLSGGSKALETYAKSDYEIELHSFISDKDIAWDRVEKRDRALWKENEFDVKYEQFLKNFQQLAKSGHTTYLYFNNANDDNYDAPYEGAPLMALFNNAKLQSCSRKIFAEAEKAMLNTDEPSANADAFLDDIKAQLPPSPRFG